MVQKEIIKLLKENETDFMKVKTFSKLPGIYALFYIGNNFPLIGDSVTKHQIIYIGKTESSQEKRDAKTHFSSGKTGSSTVRKSIGSILCEKENLIPIPRNESDYKKGKFSHFKFDQNSEEKITNWMKNNLAISFYEFNKTKQEIEDLETKIIHQLVPILNISKNPHNTFRNTLKSLRKNCALMASKDFNLIKNLKESILITPLKTKNIMHINSDIIFINNITKTDAKNRIIRILVDNKKLFPSEERGKPITYNLNFRFYKEEFESQYIIGSMDGKSRSGVLKLGDRIYNEILKIKVGTELKISLNDKIYTIERL